MTLPDEDSMYCAGEVSWLNGVFAQDIMPGFELTLNFAIDKHANQRVTLQLIRRERWWGQGNVSSYVVKMVK